MSPARAFLAVGAILVVVGLSLVLFSGKPEEVVVAEEVPTDWNFFTSAYFGFSLRYPPGYAADTSYRPEGVPEVTGLALAVPPERAEGTTLSPDTRISIEATEGTCTAQRFLPNAGPAREIIENGVTYQVASAGEGAAGNRYEETVYVIEGVGRCIAVRYFIHSTEFANYPAGSVEAFDREALLDEFHMIRRTLRLAGA